MDERRDAEVDTNCICRTDVCWVWFLWRGLVEVEAGVPCAGFIFFDGDVFHVCRVWQATVKSDGNVQCFAVNFLEYQSSASSGATLLIKFEAPLPVGETAVLVRRFPVQ